MQKAYESTCKAITEGFKSNANDYAEKAEALKATLFQIKDICNTTLDLIELNNGITVVEAKFDVSTLDGIGELARRAASLQHDLVICKNTAEYLRRVEDSLSGR